MNKHNFIENQLIILTKQTLDTFFKADNPAELIALYTFYYYTAKWQGTNQPKCTTGYAANGIKWTEARLRKVKKQLIDYGLIEDITQRDENGKITGHYIRMNYMFSKENEPDVENDCPHYGKSDRVAEQETNALSANSINALSVNSINAIKKERKKQDFNSLLDEFANDNEKTRELLGEWLKVRKAKRAAMTDRAISLNLDKLKDIAQQSNMGINTYLEAVIMRGWAAFYVIKDFSGSGKQNTAQTLPNGAKLLPGETYEKGRIKKTDGTWVMREKDGREFCASDPANDIDLPY